MTSISMDMNKQYSVFNCSQALGIISAVHLQCTVLGIHTIDSFVCFNVENEMAKSLDILSLVNHLLL